RGRHSGRRSRPARRPPSRPRRRRGSLRSARRCSPAGGFHTRRVISRRRLPQPRNLSGKTPLASRYDRGAVGRGLSADARERYDSALAGVWGDLSRTLASLEGLAAEPDELDDQALDVLPYLQYALHRAGELTARLDPPLVQ